MDDRKVDEILKIHHRGITKLVGTAEDERSAGWTIVGFDSEYNTKRDELISYQLYASEETQRIIPGPKRLSVREIAGEARNLVGRYAKRILLVSYFNTAELSQLSTGFWTDSSLKIYPAHPSGILHIEGRHQTGTEYDRRNVGDYEFFFFDLWHWFASMKNNSLYAVAEMLGYEKLDWHRKGESHQQSISTLRANDLHNRQFREYAIHDAKLCVNIFNKLDSTFRDINRVSIISRPTPANASQASFRRNYLKKNLDKPHHQIRKLALQANWGGRAECGFVGSQQGIYEFDADSLYPRALLLLPNLPGPNEWHRNVPSNLEGIEGFIDIDFQFKDTEEVWPNLPVYFRGSLIFPREGRSKCTIGELRAALQRDGFTIIKIHNIVWYSQGSYGEFHSFIRDQLRLKEENNDNAAIRAVAKLNMNSAIGKFVQWKGGYNYNLVAEYLEEYKINDPHIMRLMYDGKILPEMEWLDKHGLDRSDPTSWYRQPIRLGASFYPEWHTLILGKAREQISLAVYNNPEYPRCLTIATDALYIPSDRISGREAVPFKRERGPMVFKPFRTRRHLSIGTDGQTLVAAHHGMPMSSSEAAYMMALSNHEEKIVVNARGMYTAREAIHKDGRFGQSKSRSITINFEPDTKRRLSDSGWTYPWLTIEQMCNSL